MDIPEEPPRATPQPLTRPERPIEREADDLLERVGFVNRLAETLVNPATRKATGVVIGITGPWGSGKSSVLNLLELRLTALFAQAVVVRFDPWLVSGRDDVIAAFFSSFLDAIKSRLGDPHLFATARHQAISNTLDAIATYGTALSPLLNTVKPGLSILGGLAAKGAEKALRSRLSLDRQKKVMATALDELGTPVIVLIDELDRIEDDEIRVMAQVIRSIADFSQISYVLAYDEKRVTQALGEGTDAAVREERGRSYLEKIVQLQIPLPITLDTELTQLLGAEVRALREELLLPVSFETGERYTELTGILIPAVIQTPRDIKRLIGTYHALAGMLRGEVDPVDLLAYCALLTKAPRSVDDIRKDAGAFVEDAFSIRESARRLDRDKLSEEEYFAQLLPNAEKNEWLPKLVRFLFPSASQARTRYNNDRVDPLCLRRPLYTTLRLGLLHGDYPRVEIERLFDLEPEEVSLALNTAYAADTIVQLVDRLDDIYSSLYHKRHTSFWNGVAAFLQKPDCEWMTQYSPMHEVSRNFAVVLERAGFKVDEGRAIAQNVFMNFVNAGEDIIAAMLVRHHIFLYGLYGNAQQGDRGRAFLEKGQTESVARDMSLAARRRHLEGKFIPCRWDLQPLYTAVDMGVWDEQCRTKLSDALTSDTAIDGLTLMLFGRQYTTDGTTIEKICGLDSYRDRARLRLSSESAPGATPMHESVRIAYKKALDERW